jgi:hypothetical protein
MAPIERQSMLRCDKMNVKQHLDQQEHLLMVSRSMASKIKAFCVCQSSAGKGAVSQMLHVGQDGVLKEKSISVGKHFLPEAKQSSIPLWKLLRLPK